ncbi:hypothetical protein ACLOJK_009359 [Asimina triloba]
MDKSHKTRQAASGLGNGIEQGVNCSLIRFLWALPQRLQQIGEEGGGPSHDCIVIQAKKLKDGGLILKLFQSWRLGFALLLLPKILRVCIVIQAKKLKDGGLILKLFQSWRLGFALLLLPKILRVSKGFRVGKKRAFRHG